MAFNGPDLFENPEWIRANPGRCVSCGFLGKLNIGEQWPSPGLWQITEIERAAGAAFRHVPAAHDGVRQTEPFCIVRAAPVSDELRDILSASGAPEWEPSGEATTAAKAAAKQVFEKDRGCERWYEYTSGFSPTEHLAEFKMLELEQRRKEFETRLDHEAARREARANRVFLFVGIAALILAGVQIWAQFRGTDITIHYPSAITQSVPDTQDGQLPTISEGYP